VHSVRFPPIGFGFFGVLVCFFVLVVPVLVVLVLVVLVLVVPVLVVIVLVVLVLVIVVSVVFRVSRVSAIS
jgi:hypothetical protein